MDTRARGTGSSFRNLLSLIVCSALFVLGIRYTNLLRQLENEKALFDEQKFDLTQTMKENAQLQVKEKDLKNAHEDLLGEKDKCNADSEILRSDHKTKLEELEGSKKHAEEEVKKCSEEKNSLNNQNNDCKTSKEDMRTAKEAAESALVDSQKELEALKNKQVPAAPADKAASKEKENVPKK